MRIVRCLKNPIIWPNMPGLRWGKGNNINGPTLIRVPAWVKNPLGKYYLYFGHHNGQYIRLAYADSPMGPFRISKEQILHIKNLPLKCSHVASPEIYIDDHSQILRIYYHSNVRGTGIYSDQVQMSFSAFSSDGIHFKPSPIPLAPFYLRVFRYRDYFYGLAKNENKNGIFIRSRDGISEFERGAEFIPKFRHCALYRKDSVLYVLFTRAGDAPESILFSTVDLTPDWQDWLFSEPKIVLKPEKEWEGADLPIIPSKYGSTNAANALRDPFFFEEESKMYLLYSIKGERGIAIAEIQDFFEN
jgi:hypothetical protein